MLYVAAQGLEKFSARRAVNCPVVAAHGYAHTLANDDLGKKVLKRVVVEGYTDKTGSYLSNLNLSLQRSQRVLCTMFSMGGANLLSDQQKEEVRSLFLVGGYSFNAAKDTDEESRRVEMRMEFLGMGEQRASAMTQTGNFGECALR